MHSLCRNVSSPYDEIKERKRERKKELKGRESVRIRSKKSEKQTVRARMEEGPVRTRSSLPLTDVPRLTIVCTASRSPIAQALRSSASDIFVRAKMRLQYLREIDERPGGRADKRAGGRGYARRANGHSVRVARYLDACCGAVTCTRRHLVSAP